MTDLRTRYQYGLLLSLLAPLAARADISAAVNLLRARGCGAHPPGAAALQPSRALDAVAAQLSRGMALREAQQRAHYHAVSSFSVSISGVAPGADVQAVLARQYCANVTDPAFTQIGVYREGTRVWLALATPFAPPAAAEAAAIAPEVLALINAARARARRCGGSAFAPAPPLTRDATLERVARAYAQEMARHGYMDHTARDGSSPAERVTRGGYRWLETGENLARGIMRPAELVNGWLHSPEHCANLMQLSYTQLGVGFAVNPQDPAGVYWALELGRPRAH